MQFEVKKHDITSFIICFPQIAPLEAKKLFANDVGLYIQSIINKQERVDTLK